MARKGPMKVKAKTRKPVATMTGADIKQICRKHAMKQKELAEQLGRDPKAFSMIATGKRPLVYKLELHIRNWMKLQGIEDILEK